MTVSSTASVSATINTLLSGTGSTNTTTKHSATYNQLKTALDAAIASGSGSAVPLYQSLVTLSKNENSDDATAAQTYDAKGLLTKLRLATNLSDPLLQSEEATKTSGLPGGAANNTSLSALYAAIGKAGNDN